MPGQPSERELADDPFLCRFVIVFDREGYSPEFFREMWVEYRIACLSYHKHQGGDWPVEFFAEHKVVNPEWRDLEKERTSITGKLRHRRVRFAELSMNPEEEDDEKRHLKWENSKAALLEDIRQYESRLEEVKIHARETPRHITWSELPEGQKFNKLATSRPIYFPAKTANPCG